MRKVTRAFVRHAKVPSYDGDMTITPASHADIEAALPRRENLAEQGAP